MSSSEASDTEITETLTGFQFEPKKNAEDMKVSDGWTTYDESSEEEGESDTNLRISASVDTWCKCAKCMEMSTEKECLCCQELEAANLFELKGNTPYDTTKTKLI